MLCLTSSRFTQRATRLPLGETPDPTNPGGHWENRQDPDSGAIVKVWITEDPTIPDDGGSEDFICMARSFVSGGVTGNGTVERYVGAKYDLYDVVRINYQAKVSLRLDDRITNITDSHGKCIYTEDNGEPTVYNIDGISPILDPFGNLIEWTALLSRAETQPAVA